MKKLLFLAFMALVMVMMYSCEKENLNSDFEDTELQLRASKKNAVTPFKGTYTTYPMIVGGEPGVYLDAVVLSEGNATHLGKSEWYGEGRVDFLPEPPAELPTQIGPCYFVSANKDTLHGKYSGSIIPSEDDPVFTGWGNYEILRGTGRLFGTTGYGTYNYTVDELPDGSYKGTLYFDGVLINP